MRTRARLVGLLASLILIGLIVGLPVTLLALGANPLPDALPTLEQLRTAITTPDDGTLALGAIKVIAWAAWFILALSVLLELFASVRGLRAPVLPGLSLPQGAARQLVAAAALLFVAFPAAAPQAHAGPAQAPMTATAITDTQNIPGEGSTDPASNVDGAANETATPPTYIVQRGDTLSGIAQQELGDANRWTELADLNPQVAAQPDVIYAGTVLSLPEAPHTTATHLYVVKAGDTLANIAEAELGDATKYPAIFEASRDTLQPGGIHLTDPDHIDVGQTLTIPHGAGAAPTSPSTSTPAPNTTSSVEFERPSPPPPPAAQPSDPLPAPAPVNAIPSGAAHTSPASSATEVDSEQATPAAWMVAGLTGGGALLAGSMLMLLRRRRRAQFRNRRPGHTLASPETVLGPVEKTITVIGSATAPTVEHMDHALRRLATATAAAGETMPVLAAVELTSTHLVLHLAEPADLPQPWDGTPDRMHWKISPSVPLDELGPHITDQPAPYPLLVTIGLGEREEIWLLNIEDLNVTITGDTTFGQDFARYLAAEVACNPWSAGVSVACLGVATELGALNPDRIHIYDAPSDPTDPVGEMLADAVSTIDRTREAGADAATARALQSGADVWPARMLLVDAATTSPALDQLLNLIDTHPGHTATSVVIAGARVDAPGTLLHVTDQGRVTMPEAGLDLVAVGLTSDEALGCASLLAHSETITEIAVPVDHDATDGWRAFADEAGALRREHTLPRHDPDTADDTASLLDQDDDTYLGTAATTSEDLQVLAPRVSHHVRDDLEDSDPSLDDDLAMWMRDDSALPKLRLLGPVRATTRGTPLTKRKPYMTELLAFLALRPLGATPAEVAEAFNISNGKARDYVNTVRRWLGTNPRTNDHHLPDARLAPAATIRDVPVYQIVDILIDADLFRRLRVRGEARGGAQGMADLRTALSLVQGRPFDYPIQREIGGGWTWLIDGDRLDEHLTVAIVDVAHLIVTHALAERDLPTARLAAETAAMAAPYEEIPRLDLAAIAAAEGRQAEAQRIVRDEICNRSDDDSAPPELPARTEQILRTRKGWTDSKAS